MSRHDNPQLAACEPVEVTAERLRAWNLPEPDSEGDKETRGSVLVIGGTSELPGALILAGTAALRAGAGKLQMGTARSIAVPVGVAVPESYVFGLRELNDAEIDPSEASLVAERARKAQALLLGPGLIDSPSTKQFIAATLPLLDRPNLVLDAGALHCLRDAPDILHPFEGNVVLTPHIGEMANLTHMSKDDVAADPLTVARKAATHWRAVVALKGAETYVVTPQDEVYCWRSGGVGLATSGSGDTLAGVVAGLFARGATAAQAAVWGVYLHGEAGNVLSRRVGPIGFLARELLAEIPALMSAFADTHKQNKKGES
jgi:ADP-dependent NAD(P)H-hydrate dehydratase